MASENRKLTNVSDTALWVAVYRALESSRRDAIFRDKFAEKLAGKRGFEIVRNIPQGMSGAWSVVARTAVFDSWITELLQKREVTVVLNLAAGLDARPYRLEIPTQTRWIEVDLPGILSYKSDVLKNDSPNCRLERWPCDLANSEEMKILFEGLNKIDGNILLLTEGLLVYLAEYEVSRLVGTLSTIQQIKYWITDLNSPAGLLAMKNKWGKSLKNAKSSMKFAPKEGADFFARWGWLPHQIVFNTDAARKLKREMKWGKFWRYFGFLFSKQYRQRMKDPTKLVMFTRTDRRS